VDKYTAEPPRRNPRDESSDIQVSGAQVGSDWLSQLSAWWVEHRRYPEDARQRGETGTVIIRFTVNRQGRTSRAEIVSRSGSMALDLQAVATFSNVRLPPFPFNTPENEATLTLTINYMLLR
jgi:protein TonB